MSQSFDFGGRFISSVLNDLDEAIKRVRVHSNASSGLQESIDFDFGSQATSSWRSIVWEGIFGCIGDYSRGTIPEIRLLRFIPEPGLVLQLTQTQR